MGSCRGGRSPTSALLLVRDGIPTSTRTLAITCWGCVCDKELEKRFVEERVGYARTPVGQIGIVTLVVWYVHELRLLYEPSLSFALVTAIYLAIVRTRT